HHHRPVTTADDGLFPRRPVQNHSAAPNRSIDHLQSSPHPGVKLHRHRHHPTSRITVLRRRFPSGRFRPSPTAHQSIRRLKYPAASCHPAHKTAIQHLPHHHLPSSAGFNRPEGFDVP